jgi:hypothetical protein
MKNATLSWTLPTLRESGGPLDVSEIQHVLVEISADNGVNYTELNRVAPPATTLLVPDLETGTWKFHLTVVDMQDRRSAAVPFEVLIPDESPPLGVSNVTVVLS